MDLPREVLRYLSLALKYLPDLHYSLYTPKLEAMRDRMKDLRKGMPPFNAPAEKVMAYLRMTRESMRVVCAVIEHEYAEKHTSIQMDLGTRPGRARHVLECLDRACA
jgi:hypothetical protein